MIDLLRAGGSALILVVLMLGGGLLLWVGVPVAWLYIGSQVQAATDSLGAALGTVFVGSIASIVTIVWALGWLNRKHVELRDARGLETQRQTALEAVMTVSAIVAVVAFCFWFFILQGPGPSLAPSQ